MADEAASPEARQMAYVALACLAALPSTAGSQAADGQVQALAALHEALEHMAAQLEHRMQASEEQASAAAVEAGAPGMGAGLQQGSHAEACADGAAGEEQPGHMAAVPGYLQQQLLQYRHEKLKLLRLCMALVQQAACLVPN